jgi:hypothetical protein
MHDWKRIIAFNLNKISKQIEQPWQVPQDDNRFDPSRGLLEIKKWGSWPKKKWVTQMNGLLNNGKWKDKVHLLPWIGQGETPDQ